MNIGPKRIAEQMIKFGHTKERIENHDFSGWTNDFMDTIEMIYGLEAKVRKEIVKKGRGGMTDGLTE